MDFAEDYAKSNNYESVRLDTFSKNKRNNIFYENIGSTQKDYFEIQGELKINIKELYKINNQWYNNY